MPERVFWLFAAGKKHSDDNFLFDNCLKDHGKIKEAADNETGLFSAMKVVFERKVK